MLELMSTDVSKTTALAPLAITDDHDESMFIRKYCSMNQTSGMCAIPKGGWREAKESSLEDYQKGPQKVNKNVPGKEGKVCHCRAWRVEE